MRSCTPESIHGVREDYRAGATIAEALGASLSRMPEGVKATAGESGGGLSGARRTDRGATPGRASRLRPSVPHEWRHAAPSQYRFVGPPDGVPGALGSVGGEADGSFKASSVRTLFPLCSR